jgi:acyl carrier protein
VLAPVRLDSAALRARARAGALPPILSGLVRARPRRGDDSTDSLQRRLSGVPESKWPEIVVDMVRDQVASVRGLESREAVKPDLAFKDMGFDSLAAVELRNGLTRSTGIRLPATVVFDHPTPAAVAEHMLGRLSRAGTARPAIEDEFDRIERLLQDAPTDEQTRTRVEARVRAFNARVQSLLMGSGDSEDGAPDEDLESASNEEMFALIDKEIGAS